MIDFIEELEKFVGQDVESNKILMQEVHLVDGQILFHQGDPGDAFYRLERGKIRVFIVDSEGNELTLNTMSAGESLGEMALLNDEPRSASAIAVGACTLLRIKRSIFWEMVESYPALNRCLVQILNERARHMTEYILKLGEWVRMVINSEYEEILEDMEQLEEDEDKVVQAVVNSLKQMVHTVYQRETNLKQEIKELKTFMAIDPAEMIDQQKRKEEVEEIISTESFQSILERAEKLKKAEAKKTAITGQKFSLIHLDTETKFPLPANKKTIYIGRGDSRMPVDIDLSSIPNASVISRLHCMINVTSNGYYLEDANSVNGTFLNDREIEKGGVSEAELQLGDTIVLSRNKRIKFRFEAEK